MMDGWMDGWMDDGRMDGWMDGWMDGCIDWSVSLYIACIGGDAAHPSCFVFVFGRNDSDLSLFFFFCFCGGIEPTLIYIYFFCCFAGVLGTAMSVFIRLQLASPGNQFLGGGMDGVGENSMMMLIQR